MSTFIKDSTTAANAEINLAQVAAIVSGPFEDGSSGLEFHFTGNQGARVRWAVTAANVAATQAAILAAVLTPTVPFLTDTVNTANPPVQIAAIATLTAGPFEDNNYGLRFVLQNGAVVQWLETSAANQATALTNVTTTLAAVAVAE